MAKKSKKRKDTMTADFQFTEDVPSGPLDALPDLTDVPTYIAVDMEHLGLGSEAVACGLAVATQDREWYLPFGHASGKQYTPEAVSAWANDHLRGQRIAFLNAKNDIRVMKRRKISNGIFFDCEKAQVQPMETQHGAALLNDRRRVFTLEQLSQDYLGRGKLTPMYQGKEVPKHEIQKMPAHLAAPYAKRDVRNTWDLAEKLQPMIEAEDMGPLLQMEDDLIYSTMYMEDVKCFIDRPKLERWHSEVTDAYSERILELHRRTGMRLNPNTSKDMVRLFRYLGKSYGHTLSNNPSFTDSFLNNHLDVPEIKLCSEARDLSSLKSKYLHAYLVALDGKNRLPYSLHQLRGDEYGTIRGRYSSSKKNIQQVFKPDKQINISPCTWPWVIRELFVPGSDEGFIMRFTVHDELNGDLNGRFIHADASQIEYRLFAHYSCIPKGSMRIINAYRDNPNLSYHKWVHRELLNSIIIYSHAKNFNFAKLYGAGFERLSDMLNVDVSEAKRLSGIYDNKVPEARDLLWFCANLAEERGFVKTLMNRRARLIDGFHAALNCILQGGAADIMKKKILRMYREMPHIRNKADFDEVLAIQEFELRVPITWESEVGDNWLQTCVDEDFYAALEKVKGGVN